MKKQNSLRVLIVYDSPVAAQSLSCVVIEMGHDVSTASPSSAIAKIERFSPDVVMIDIQGPGFRGIELCRAIRAAPDHWHLWIVAITGRDDLGTIESSGASGFDVGIPRPVDATGLEKLLAQFELMLGRD